jgi:hypothetical protein
VDAVAADAVAAATSLMVERPSLSPVCKEVSLELNKPPVAPLRNDMDGLRSALTKAPAVR